MSTEVIGLKDIGIKLSHIERSLDRIAKALELQNKIMNRQAPRVVGEWLRTAPETPYEEDEDDGR